MSDKPASENKGSAATKEQILDVVAFSTFSRARREEKTTGSETLTEDILRDEWQAQPRARVANRLEAEKLISELSASGLSLRPSDSNLVRKRVTWLTTQPARLAYDPAAEVEVAAAEPASVPGTGSNPDVGREDP